MLWWSSGVPTPKPGADWVPCWVLASNPTDLPSSPTSCAPVPWALSLMYSTGTEGRISPCAKWTCLNVTNGKGSGLLSGRGRQHSTCKV